MAGNSFFHNIVSLLHESNYSHLFLNGECNFRRAVAAVNCLYTMYLTNISIYIRRIVISRSTCSHAFQWYRHYFSRPITVIWYFQWYCISLKQAPAIIPFFRGIDLIRNFSVSHLFDEWPLLLWKSNWSHSFSQMY